MDCRRKFDVACDEIELTYADVERTSDEFGQATESKQDRDYC
jgi:hypothetical protein